MFSTLKFDVENKNSYAAHGTDVGNFVTPFEIRLQHEAKQKDSPNFQIFIWKNGGFLDD